ncbi:MAG: hypothetical protein WC889_14870 [Myxococcota bacterium]
MKRALMAAVMAAAIAFAIAGCTSENTKYLQTVSPIAAKMEKVAAEATALATEVRAKNEAADAVSRVDALEKNVQAINMELTNIMAPPDYVSIHAAMVKGMASELTGLSTLRGYSARVSLAMALRAKIDGLATGGEAAAAEKLKVEAQLEGVRKEMVGQWSYWSENHTFFTDTLRGYLASLKKK